MYVIKRIDTGKYWLEWDWMDNPWDTEKFTQEEAQMGADFFSSLNIPCEIECLD